MALFTQKGTVVAFEIEREGCRVVKRILGPSEPRSFVLDMASEAEARRRYYELIGELIDLGWERQTSPEEELMPLCREPELEALIRQAGHDEAYLIYGDWLQERGDAFGELIALHRGMASARSAGEIEAIEAQITELLQAHELNIFGAHAALPAHWRSTVGLCWKHGFVDEIAWSLSETSGRWLTPSIAREIIHSALHMPCTRLVRALAFDDSFSHYALSALLECDKARLVQKLTLHEFPSDHARLGTVLPGLRFLTLYTHGMYLAIDSQLAWPSLQELALHCDSPDWNSILQILQRPWPELAQLTLGLVWPGQYAWIDAVLTGEFMPQLTCLSLCGYRHRSQSFEVGTLDPLIERLLDAPLLHQLSSLELQGHLSNRSIAMLHQAMPRLAHLTRVRIEPARRLGKQPAALVRELTR